MHKPLEAYRLFPYVAWALVVGFAVFTFMLTMRVQAELEYVGDGVARIEAQLDTLGTEKPAR